MSLPEFEKLGAFYLGKRYDEARRQVTDELLLYDAKDLTTHAVCVGMTGSGKTGLCLSLLEEAAIDGIPAIVIDPKGDLGNLFLTFPELRPQDFEPWVDPDSAARKGMTVPEFAAHTATQWRDGLAAWGQDGQRIQRLRDAVDLRLFTPGSSAGRPISVLQSFAAPPPALREDGDALRDRVMASVSGLLALLGVDADPIRSREHILLSNLLHRAWAEGRDLDLAGLIREIQQPPFSRVGVMDLDSFFPAKDRFGLAMLINNLIASPGFSAWMEGEPLDAGRLLTAPDGRPRLSVLSIAHLSEAERMFFVTLLLNEVVAWMRTQPGSPSLRALLYMDEVFGYFPPTANPPSKTPMLTLLKQARAYGLGVILATQNPVDLDYKGLSNAGTWFLGRLQTERDKARVLDGLEGAAPGGFDRAAVDTLLSGLSSRVFLMNNVHDDGPTLFQTRWALSYLRGPMTRSQLARLCASTPAPPKSETRTPRAARPAAAAPDAGTREVSVRPVLPPDVPESFACVGRAVQGSAQVRYEPGLLAQVRLHYTDRKAGLDHWQDLTLLAPLSAAEVPPSLWSSAQPVREAAVSLQAAPLEGALFAALPAEAAKAASYRTWGKMLATQAHQERPLRLFSCPELKAFSTPQEEEGAFRARLVQQAREARDRQVESLRERYAPKLHRLEERVRKAEQRVGVEESQYREAQTSSAIQIGTTLLGALFGRRGRGGLGRAGTSARSVSRAARQKADIARAEADQRQAQADLQALEAEFLRATREIDQALDPVALHLETLEYAPRKSDTTLRRLELIWVPWGGTAEGRRCLATWAQEQPNG